MSSKDNQCAFCGNTLDKIEDGHYTCRECGFGWDGKPANPIKHIKRLENLIRYMIIQNPQKSKEELIDLIIEKLHAVEKHPLRPDGYCEYCEAVYTK